MSVKTMRVFSKRTYCDRIGQRHAKHSMYTLTANEVMSKHPITGKNLIKSGIVMRAEDWDEDLAMPIQRDEDDVGS